MMAAGAAPPVVMTTRVTVHGSRRRYGGRKSGGCSSGRDAVNRDVAAGVALCRSNVAGALGRPRNLWNGGARRQSKTAIVLDLVGRGAAATHGTASCQDGAECARRDATSWSWRYSAGVWRRQS